MTSSRTGTTLRLTWIVCISLVLLSISLAASGNAGSSADSSNIKIKAGVTGSIGNQIIGVVNSKAGDSIMLADTDYHGFFNHTLGIQF